MKIKLLIASVIALTLIVISRASAEATCIHHDVVYVERYTAIWNEPGFSGLVIVLAAPGSRYPVQDWVREGGKCWAQVDADWSQEVSTWGLGASSVAEVRAKFAEVEVFWFLMDKHTIEGREEYCEPKIEDTAVIEQINQRLADLLEKWPHWHQYVKHHDYIIQPAEPGEASSRASWPERCVYIGTNALKDETSLAYTLVHEACHIHQGYESRWPTDIDGIVRAEKDCHAKALEIVVEIDPMHFQVVLTSWMFLQDYSWWRHMAMRTCPQPSESESSGSAGQASVPARSYPDCLFAPDQW